MDVRRSCTPRAWTDAVVEQYLAELQESDVYGR